MTLEQDSSHPEELSPELAELIKPAETAIIVVDVMDSYFSQDAVLPNLVGFTTQELDAAAKRIQEFLEEQENIIQPL